MGRDRPREHDRYERGVDRERGRDRDRGSSGDLENLREKVVDLGRPAWVADCA